MSLKQSFKFTALATCLLSIVSVSAQAQDWEFQAGLGVFTGKEIWKGVDSNTGIAPIFFAKYGQWSFGEDGIVSYHFIEQDDFGFSMGVNYRDDTYDSDGLVSSKTSKDKVFEGYKSPDGDITVTATAYWDMLSVSLEQDVSGNSKGLTADLGINVPIYTVGEDFMLEASAGVNWQSSNYVDYVYGISGKQIDVSKGRTAYAPGSATNYSVGLSAFYQLNRDWTLMASVDYTKLDDKIAKSPLVGEDKVTTAFVGAIYSF